MDPETEGSVPQRNEPRVPGLSWRLGRSPGQPGLCVRWTSPPLSSLFLPEQRSGPGPSADIALDSSGPGRDLLSVSSTDTGHESTSIPHSA